jgi:hypothetical protein
MAPRASKRWQESSDADLDYGFDSDELDTRYNEPDLNTSDDNTSKPRDTQTTDDKGLIASMSSWLQRQAGSSHGQLATAAVVSGAAVAGAIFGYQSYKRKEAVHDLKASIPSIDDLHTAETVSCNSEAAHSVSSKLQDKKMLIRRTIAHRFWRRLEWSTTEQGRRAQCSFSSQGATGRLR